MHTEAEAFLQRIRAFPDDDTPRLIFADWLQEQDGFGVEWGIDRARFIRVQIALARLLEEEAAADETEVGNRGERESLRAALRRAESGLQERHRVEWTAAFKGLATGPEFRRGFVDEVKVAARDLVRHSHELFSAGPLRHLRLLDLGGSLTTVFQCAYLSRLHTLTVFAQHAGEPLARAVAQCPHLSSLRTLRLARNRFEDAATVHLAAGAVLANLEELDLSENELGETGARSLAASPHLGSLRRLELGGNRLGPAGAEAIAGSERLTALHRLGLSGNEIGSPRLHSLSRAHNLLRIPVLDLSENTLNPGGLSVILTLPHSRTPSDAVRLRELDLSHNELGNEGVRMLAACPHLSGLRVLKLAGCGIGDDGARSLAYSPYLNQLVTLDLGNNPIGNPGFRPFLDTLHKRSLRRLGVPVIGVSREMKVALDNHFPHGCG